MKTRIEVQIEDQPNPDLLEVEAETGQDIRKAVLAKAGFDEAYIFQHDTDVDVGDEILGKKAVVLVLHRCKKIMVSVQYEHETKTKKFTPAATVNRVLLWAVGRNGFKLDPDARSKANLILPGADQPLPRGDAIGKYADKKSCSLVVSLTLKDFNNG